MGPRRSARAQTSSANLLWVTKFLALKPQLEARRDSAVNAVIGVRIRGVGVGVDVRCTYCS